MSVETTYTCDYCGAKSQEPMRISPDGKHECKLCRDKHQAIMDEEYGPG